MRFDDYCGWGHLPSGGALCAGYFDLERGHDMLKSQAHLLVWAAFVFYASFAWHKKQAVEIDPMQTSSGWLTGELRPPT